MAQTDKIGRAGEHFVAAELNRRGAYASPFSGSVPGIDIVATDDHQERMTYIQVKTKRKTNQSWTVSLRYAWNIPNDVGGCLCLEACDASRCANASVRVRTHPHHPNATNLLTLQEVQGKKDHYWVFISLEELQYWIVPDDTVRSMIRHVHIEYLRERGGHRPGSKHDSLHNVIWANWLSSWHGRWDTLGLGLEEP